MHYAASAINLSDCHMQESSYWNARIQSDTPPRMVVIVNPDTHMLMQDLPLPQQQHNAVHVSDTWRMHACAATHSRTLPMRRDDISATSEQARTEGSDTVEWRAVERGRG